MKKIITLCFSCLALLGSAQHSRIFPQPLAVRTPQPVSSEWQQALSVNQLVLPADRHTQGVTDALKNTCAIMTGLSLTTGKQSNVSCIQDAQLAPEAYTFSVNAQGIHITYGSEAGLFYAMESLMWQFDPAVSAFPYVDVSDAPRFSWRGAHLDCSRHFFTVSEVMEFLDRLALFKINRFHWHLTDDQGWRIEIKKYPKLTGISGWRAQTLVGHFSDTPAVYDGQRYGGYYTQEEIRQVVAHAKTLHIEVVPEIEMPGHARAALAAYPELGCAGSGYTVAETWGVFEDIFCSKQETRDFLKDVLSEVCALFPYEVIHIGGDEAPKKKWNECPNCTAVRNAHHLADAHALQSFFVNDMVLFLKSKGKRLMGWDEILEGGLPEDAEVMSWRGTEGGIAAARAGHRVVMTPTAYCYFDYYQSSSPKEPLCIGGYLPVEKAYSYDPVPKELTDKEKPYILGVQANMWSEYLPTMERVYEQYFPRLFALAENAWSPSKTSYAGFSDALSGHGLERLDRLGIPYSKTFLYPTLREFAENGEMIYRFESVTGDISYYTMQGKTDIRVPAISDVEYDSTWIYISLNGRKIDSLPFKVLRHRLLGSHISFDTPPSEKYNLNQEIALTDGIVGEKPWKGNQWLGFDTSTVRFSFTIPKKVRATQLNIGFLHDPGSWIYRPQNLVLERKTKTGYEAAGSFSVTSDQPALPVRLFAGEYRVTIRNYDTIPEGMPGEGFTPWTFIDEIFIR